MTYQLANSRLQFCIGSCDSPDDFGDLARNVITEGGAHNMRVRWTGIGEAELAGYDRVGLFIGLNNGAQVEHSRSYAPGGNLGCARMALVETVKCAVGGCPDRMCTSLC